MTGVLWPTLTVSLPPKEKATGAAVVICPGSSLRRDGKVLSENGGRDF